MFAMIAKITPCHGSISPLFDKHDLPAGSAARTRIAAGRWHYPRAATGNATQYQASVFNFARTWESIYLNFDLDALRPPGALS
jgi:hypothetical protein